MEKKKTNYYQSLYEAAVALNSARTPESVPWHITLKVARAMDAKGCSLLLLTPDRKHLLHTASSGLSEWYVRKAPLRVDKSIAEALKGKSVAILNAAEDDRVQYRKQKKREGIASILCVPMRLREESIGVIRVYTSEPRQFTEDDIYFVEAIANLGAIALENARLYDSVQKDYDALRQDMLQWRSALGYDWMAEESVIPPKE